MTVHLMDKTYSTVCGKDTMPWRDRAYRVTVHVDDCDCSGCLVQAASKAAAKLHVLAKRKDAKTADAFADEAEELARELDGRPTHAMLVEAMNGSHDLTTLRRPWVVEADTTGWWLRNQLTGLRLEFSYSDHLDEIADLLNGGDGQP